MTDADRAAWEQRFNEVTELARRDARAGVEPRVLEVDRAEWQSDYDAEFTRTELEMLAERAAN